MVVLCGAPTVGTVSVTAWASVGLSSSALRSMVPSSGCSGS